MRQYTSAIDVWSVGCILAELLRRKPLLPARTEQEQMMMITNLIGKPTEEIISQITEPNTRAFMNELPPYPGKDFSKLFRQANPQAVDLVKQMLVFDPEKRITIADALAHPYLAELHNKDDEPIGEQVSHFDFDFELFSLSINEFKDLI